MLIVLQVTVRWIFYYLDQSFLLHSKDQPVIREMGLIQFRSYIFNDSSLKPKILKGAYNLIAADRGGDVAALADSTLLREAMDLFHNLDVYDSDFEPLLMTESREVCYVVVSTGSCREPGYIRRQYSSLD